MLSGTIVAFEHKNNHAFESLNWCIRRYGNKCVRETKQYWDIRLHTLCVQIVITKDSRLRTSCHLVVFTIRCLNRIFYKLITITRLLFFIKTQMKTWTVLRVSNTEFVKLWFWEKNMSGGILRSVLVFLLENHFVRFVVTLLMSCAYDTYSYGKDSLPNYI